MVCNNHLIKRLHVIPGTAQSGNMWNSVEFSQRGILTAFPCLSLPRAAGTAGVCEGLVTLGFSEPKRVSAFYKTLQLRGREGELVNG